MTIVIPWATNNTEVTEKTDRMFQLGSFFMLLLIMQRPE